MYGARHITDFRHRGKTGSVFISGDGSYYFGQVLNAVYSNGEMVSFDGDSIEEAEYNFRVAVDDYLD